MSIASRCLHAFDRSSSPIALLSGLISAALLTAPPLQAIPPAERSALIDLYNATNGPGWTNRSGWTTVGGTECAWYGITCTGQLTNVIAVQLPANNLAGSIPATLASLSLLETLDLSANALAGPLPPQLGNLAGLTYLSLEQNGLTGTIPTQLGNLASLGLLYLADNQLTGGIPPQLGNATGLGFLRLDGNRLGGPIPAEIGNLTGLQQLRLDRNQLSGPIPTSLTALSALPPGRLDLRYGALTSADPGLTSFLNSKQLGGDWQSTQTVAPTGVSAGSATPSSVVVSWTPIVYTGGPGYYTVSYATAASGPYTTFPTVTSSKLDSSLVVSGLATEQTYYFRVTTTSLPSAVNQNTLTSEPSAPVAGATACPAITVLPAVLPAGATAQVYQQDITATGGSFPYTFAATGTLPPGLTLTAAGFLFGTPASSGVFDFTVTATDSKGCHGARAFSVTISCPAITVSPASLPAGAAGVAYEQLLVASGGVAPYSFEVVGSLPGGLTLSAAGRLAGTPLSTGTTTFGVRATDARGCAGMRSYTLDVTCGGTPIRVGPPSLPGALVGQPYAQLLTASGGTDPYTFQASGDLPPGLALSSSGELAGTPTTAGSFAFSVIATDAAGCTGSTSYELAVAAACPVPGAPTLTVTPGSATAGQSLLASWTPAASLLAGGRYVVETSRAVGFEPLESSTTTTATSILLATATSPQEATLSVRVHAEQPCGTAGPVSASVPVSLAGNGPNVILTRSGASLIAALGDPPPSGTVSLRNTGGAAASLTLSVEGDLVDVSPAALALAPGEEAVATLTARPSSLTAPGTRAATLVVTGGGPTLRTIVVLTVVPAPTPPGSRAGTRARSDVTTVRFAAPAGQSPSPQLVTITVDPIVGPGPVTLTASVAPGGSWLRLGDELSQPVPASGRLTLTLSVDRAARAAADGPPPLRTLLRLTPAGATDDDAAVLEVIDAEPLPVGPGYGRGDASRAAAREALAVIPPPGGTSFLVPAVVKASGANGAEFFSDGWLRNVSASDAPVDLYYTPRDRNGLAPADVLRVTTAVPSSHTLRVADLLGSLFGTDGSGQLEIRSQVPQALTLRTTVEAVTGGDAALRFGTEVPTVSYRSGAGLGEGELVIPGISENADNRSNLIVAETVGSAATFEVAVLDASGETRGQATYTVPPYGQMQLNGFVKSIVPGLDLTGGWASVRVVSGSGRVFPIATRIDNRSNSFSAIRGSLVTATSAARSPDSPNATPAFYMIPAVVDARGANDTRFVSSLSMVNGTAREARLALTYLYDDLDAGTTGTATATVTIPPRGALPGGVGDDFLRSLFGVAAQSRGWVKVEGDVGAVTAVAAISTPVDPLDPSRGKKTAQVNGLLSTAPAMLTLGTVEHRFAGMEKSVAKRTNLVLVENAGQASQVTLRATSRTGQVLKEMSVSVAPNQYFQINDLFGPSGLGLGDGPFADVEISARVTAGAGRVVGVVTVNDNLSKNPAVFVLEDAGPPAPSIGF